VLGSHTRSYEGIAGTVQGTSFAVWAPSAQGVRLTGDFNYWDGRAHPMRAMGSTGVWELFVPGLGDGTHYKFEVLGKDGVWRQKADPVAFRAEVPPATASVVFTSEYEATCVPGLYAAGNVLRDVQLAVVAAAEGARAAFGISAALTRERLR
jgi:1,4-alpha-glucan branching enzyme